MFIKGDSCLVGARGHRSDHMQWWDSYTITNYTRYIFNAGSEWSVRLWSYVVVIRNNKLFNGRSLPPGVSSWGLLGRGNYHGVLAYWVVRPVWVWGMITGVWLYIYIYCKLFHQGVMPPLGYVCQVRVWEVWLVELPGCDVIVQP